jgi:predicted GNAT family N-acyltransferase
MSRRDLIIREADWRKERDTLLAIRYRVFVHEQGVPPELEEDAADPSALHLLAISETQGPVGTGRLLPDGHIGRMAVDRAFRGQGIGSALVAYLIDLAREAGHQTVALNAQCSAEEFYARFGFHAQGQAFEEAGIPHRHMRLQL